MSARCRRSPSRCLDRREPELSTWKAFLGKLKNPLQEVRIGLVGKYVDLTESYKSLSEALIHGGIANDCRVHLKYVDSEALERHGIGSTFNDVDGIMPADEVADMINDGAAEGRFLILTHPQVAIYCQRKAAEHDRWISGMQRFRRKVLASS